MGDTEIDNKIIENIKERQMDIAFIKDFVSKNTIVLQQVIAFLACENIEDKNNGVSESISLAFTTDTEDGLILHIDWFSNDKIIEELINDRKLTNYFKTNAAVDTLTNNFCVDLSFNTVHIGSIYYDKKRVFSNCQAVVNTYPKDTYESGSLCDSLCYEFSVSYSVLKQLKCVDDRLSNVFYAYNALLMGYNLYSQNFYDYLVYHPLHIDELEENSFDYNKENLASILSYYKHLFYGYTSFLCNNFEYYANNLNLIDSTKCTYELIPEFGEFFKDYGLPKQYVPMKNNHNLLTSTITNDTHISFSLLDTEFRFFISENAKLLMIVMLDFYNEGYTDTHIDFTLPNNDSIILADDPVKQAMYYLGIADKTISVTHPKTNNVDCMTLCVSVNNDNKFSLVIKDSADRVNLEKTLKEETHALYLSGLSLKVLTYEFNMLILENITNEIVSYQDKPVISNSTSLPEVLHNLYNNNYWYITEKVLAYLVNHPVCNAIWSGENMSGKSVMYVLDKLKDFYLDNLKIETGLFDIKDHASYKAYNVVFEEVLNKYFDDDNNFSDTDIFYD